MFKNLLIGNILNIISIYIAFIIALVVFYDDNTLFLFKKALISMVWFSPIVLIMLVVMWGYDFIYCQHKNKKDLFIETIIVLVMALVFFFFEGIEQESSGDGVYIAILTMSIIFIPIQYIKYLIFFFCGSN
ncbi:MAG TPA: hypothetical protein VIM88_00975 [Sulfurovum sp.]|uniref:hypothetical protein n=1 Tax=Sulfurovum sp. TaxID=1969726 RepID=UPI002F942155